jgi:hypothetical protein
MTTHGNTLTSTLAFGLIITGMLVGLPLAGIALARRPVSDYMEFPPLTRYIEHADFSWTAFGVFLSLNLLMLAGAGILLKKAFQKKRETAARSRYAFPSWGWIGLALMLGGWLLAWQRYSWFARFQGHTFCLPWAGYILLVNALCRRRSGHCPLTEHPGRFLLLFPISAVFWWFFEYLNRFVQNWYYIGVDDFGPMAYTLFASLAFATVLPAVLSTYRFLLTFTIFGYGLNRQMALTYLQQKAVAWFILFFSGSALFLIGLFPDYLFALVWAAPLLIITSLQTLTGRISIFAPMASGDWRPIISAATAALICGFFWEMWNIGSLARWEYAVPFVNRFHIFAMPVLGYGGYLPFGLECLAICLWMTPDKFVFPCDYYRLMTAASHAR